MPHLLGLSEAMALETHGMAIIAASPEMIGEVNVGDSFEVTIPLHIPKPLGGKVFMVTLLFTQLFYDYYCFIVTKS